MAPAQELMGPLVRREQSPAAVLARSTDRAQAWRSLGRLGPSLGRLLLPVSGLLGALDERAGSVGRLERSKANAVVRLCSHHPVTVHRAEASRGCLFPCCVPFRTLTVCLLRSPMGSFLGAWLGTAHSVEAQGCVG